LAPAVGMMRGELEYRDYQDNSRQVLPTWHHLAPIGTSGAFRERTVYDDGPGNTIYSSDVLRVTPTRWLEGANALTHTPRDTAAPYRIISATPRSGAVVYVFEGPGVDDRKRVEFRFTATVSPTLFRRVKEFRLSPDQPWSYRHEYRFWRAPMFPASPRGMEPAPTTQGSAGKTTTNDH
jgi:hypothetical protein